ncbi:MAG TPA: cytochrome c biogenesis protein CcsA [Bryobacteraceae bacterium]|nr:cytochrome c biogenesis protein CcsA [Bryobacteraceae bacterium]
MRTKVILALCLIAGAILAWNLHTMFLSVPDEANQGAIFRIIYFHVPAAITSFAGFYVAMFCGLGYLANRNLRLDSVAAAINEVSLAFASITLVTGSIWGRIIWGIWWTWDPRLTSYFICLLMYFGYFMLRRGIDEPHQRARMSAVLSIFACVDIVIVWKSIEWFRTQHPGPVLSIRNGGGMAPGMEAPIWWNLVALLMLSTALILIRTRQQTMQHEVETLRRYAHAY